MNSVDQAKKIYVVCVQSAKQGKTITYREVLKYLGYKANVPGHAIRFGLELAWIACSDKKLPRLTSIVVNFITGEPSPSGYPVVNWEEDARKVFNYKEWLRVDEIDWDYVWKNRKRLSDIHGTRGCWGK